MSRQTIESLKSEIIDASQKILGSNDLRPSNENFHTARYKLYDIAANDFDLDLIQELRLDPEIQALTQKVFPVSCEAGIHEECEIAQNLLEQPNLTFGHIYRTYHGDIYNALMQDELAFLQDQAHIQMANTRIAYIGGGAMPIPAMLLAQRLGCHVTIIEPHAPSLRLASALVEKIGLSHLIDFAGDSGESYDYTNTDIVFLANWIANKKPIFEHLYKYKNIRYCVFRSAAEENLSFVINDLINVCDVCEKGFQLCYKTERRASISLVSMIFGFPQNTTCLKKTEKTRPTVKSRNCPRKSRVVNCMSDVIGNTPLLRLNPEKTGLKNIELYAKCEHMNPFGSIKDRTAHGMLSPHISDIEKSGKKILELSSGNAARGLQAIASIHNSQLETISNRIRIEEMRKMLKLQGCDVRPMDESVDSSDANAALEHVDEHAAARKDTYFYTDQYRNPNNDGTHYSMTAREILEDIGHVDFFIGSVGTAGSSVGISRRLREENPYLDVTGVISDKEDFVPGIRHKDEMFYIGPFHESNYDRLIDVTSDEAIDGIIALVRNFGVMAGPSSGATYKAALNYLREIDASLGQKASAVFIVCDRVEMYLSYIEERRPELFE